MRALYRFMFASVVGLVCVGCGDGRLAASFERSFEIADAGTFVLENGRGDLDIIGEPGRTDVLILAELRTRRPSEHRDGDAKRSVVVDARPLDAGTVQLVAALDDPPTGYFLRTSVIVPEAAIMLVDDDAGDLHIAGVAALELHDGSGDAVIRDIAGDVGVDDNSGDLSIGGVGGRLDVDDGSGDVSVSDVGGTVELSDDSGDVSIRSVGGDAYVRDGSGDINIADVGGLVRLRDKSGDINVAGAADVEIESDTSGDVRIR